MNTSYLLDISSLCVAFVALCVSGYAIWRANKTTSAATFVTLNEGFSNAWKRFIEAKTDEQKNYELAELLNLFEIGCAIYIEGSLSGNSSKLMSAYTENVLNLLSGNDFAKNQIKTLLQDENTFEFIKKFLEDKKKLGMPIPTLWN